LFAGFDGAHDGVLGLVEVFGSVLVFGGVAAADVSAEEAHAEMDPAVSGLEALFAAFGVWVDVLDLFEVSTLCRHTA